MLAVRHATHPEFTDPAFEGYSRRELAPLTANIDLLRPAEGTVLAREGGSVREVLVVLKGEVSATRIGREVQRYGPGDHIGAGNVLEGTSRGRTLIAGPDLELLVINGPAYRWAAQTLPGWVDRI